MIRFMRFLFKSLVTATFAIVAVHFIRVVNIGFAVLRHFKGYGKLNTRIEVPECLSYRQITAKQRLNKELYTLLLRFLVIKDRFGILGVMQVEQTEIHIGREVHTDLIGVQTELLVFIHVADASAQLQMRHDIEIPFHGHSGGAHLLPRDELVVRHVVEIVVRPFVLAIGGDLRHGGGRAIEIEGEFRPHQEIEPAPLASEEKREVEIHHVGQIPRFIHMHMHIEYIALGVPHPDRLVVLVQHVGIQVIHALQTDREQEIIMEKPVVRSDIGIQAGSMLLAGNRIQQRRVTQIAVKRYKMGGLRREFAERTRA